jgi:hypothetical protein
VYRNEIVGSINVAMSALTNSEESSQVYPIEFVDEYAKSELKVTLAVKAETEKPQGHLTVVRNLGDNLDLIKV